MRQVKNEKGVALVTALMFTLIALGIIMTLLYMITQGTKMSAANKSYKTSLDASYGATELITKDILPTIFKNYTTGTSISAFAGSFSAVAMTIPTSGCFAQKTTKSTPEWDTGLCVTGSKSAFPSQLPDMTFNLKATNDSTGYRVYTKIVDTRCGGNSALGQKCTNSGEGGIEGLDDGSGVASELATKTMTTERKPAFYRIEVQGERAANPSEKSQLSVLYAY